MLALSKEGIIIHYSKSWNALVDFVDCETNSSVLWKSTKRGRITIGLEPSYSIYVVPNNVKSTIMSARKIKCWHCNKTTKPNKAKDRCTECNFEYQKFASREEYLTYIIDSLLVFPTKFDEDYNIKTKAIEAVAISIRNNPNNYPVSSSLYGYMREKGLM